MKRLLITTGALMLLSGSAWAQMGSPTDNGRAGTGNVLTGDAGASSTFKGTQVDVTGDLQQAYKDYSDKHYPEAAARLTILVKKAPNSLPAHQMLADIYIHQNRIKEAIPEMEQIVRLDPKDTAIRNNLGVAYLQTAQTDKAIQFYQAAQTRSPKDPVLAYQLALALEQGGKHAEAAQAFAQASMLAPKDARAPLYAGMLFHQTGHDDKAVPFLQKALALGTTDPFSAHMVLAEIDSRAGKTDAALLEYKQAAAAKPEDFNAAANLGVLSQNVGKKADAVAAYRQALTLKAGTPLAQAQVQASLASLLALDSPEEAATLLTQAAQNDPTNARYEDVLGQVYEKQGKKDLAQAAYQKALTLDPHQLEATQGLARLKK